MKYSERTSEAMYWLITLTIGLFLLLATWNYQPWVLKARIDAIEKQLSDDK